MSFVTAAIIGGVGALAGGVIASQGAQSAADTQAQAAQNAQNISQQEFNTITQQENPFVQSGYGAQSQLNYLLGIGSPSSGPTIQHNSTAQGIDSSSGYRIGQNGFISQGLIPTGKFPQSTTPQAVQQGTAVPGHGYIVNGKSIPLSSLASGISQPAASQIHEGVPIATSSTAGGFGSLLAPFNYQQFLSDPGYQFQLQQGAQAVLNGDSTGGSSLSGPALKDLIDFNQGLAGTSYNNAFNRYQTQQGNIFSRLSSIAQLGQAAAANTGQQGTALAGQAAQSATNIGTALGAGQIGSANALSGAFSNIASLPLMTSILQSKYPSSSDSGGP